MILDTENLVLEFLFRIFQATKLQELLVVLVQKLQFVCRETQIISATS